MSHEHDKDDEAVNAKVAVILLGVMFILILIGLWN